MTSEQRFFDLVLDINLPNPYEGHVASIARALSGCVYYEKETRSGQCENTCYALAKWLVDHADEDRDGNVGWGLPDSRDYFQDGSVNAPNTEYAFQTSLAAESLLDFDKVFLEPNANLIAVLALRSFLDISGPNGLPAYSLDANDAKYDVINTAAHLCGQWQRIGETEAADRVFGTIMDNAIRTITGGLYWPYGLQPNISRPNDLAHALFTLEGLRAYGDHGGAHWRFGSWLDGVRGLKMFRHSGGWSEYAHKLEWRKPETRAYFAYSCSRYKLDIQEEGCIERILETPTDHAMDLQALAYFLW